MTKQAGWKLEAIVQLPTNNFNMTSGFQKGVNPTGWPPWLLSQAIAEVPNQLALYSHAKAIPDTDSPTTRAPHTPSANMQTSG